MGVVSNNSGNRASFLFHNGLIMMKYIALFLLIFTFSTLNAQKVLLPKYNSDLKKWQYLDTNQKIVLTINSLGVKNALYFMDGMAPVQDAKTNLWGYIDTSGVLAIKAQYDTVNFFLDNYAVVIKKCKTGCYKGNAGLLSDMVSSVIDKKGKVTCTDNSQAEEPYMRYFLLENIGKGLFSISRGIGFGERQDFMNYKAEILGKTINSYGIGGIYWDEEIKAVKCGLKYFDEKGNVKLDLSLFQSISGSFSEGYIWTLVNLEAQTEEESSSLFVLVDSTGKAIVNLNYEKYSNFTPVKNGEFTCVSNDDNHIYKYDLKQEVLEKVIEYVYSPDEGETENLGYKHADGSRIIYKVETETILGIQLKNGRKFYLESSN